uniref:Uncharacterized protein n=1 Tax=Podoviridae sp. ctzMH52 TaxID=2826596 RepID=A0A8S5N2I3_9CAUD|nr:MAG TPA: hypothetical protein [Podoviridae sp. ctzMH52]
MRLVTTSYFEKGGQKMDWLKELRERREMNQRLGSHSRHTAL